MNHVYPRQEGTLTVGDTTGRFRLEDVVHSSTEVLERLREVDRRLRLMDEALNGATPMATGPAGTPPKSSGILRTLAELRCDQRGILQSIEGTLGSLEESLRAETFANVVPDTPYPQTYRR